MDESPETRTGEIRRLTYEDLGGVAEVAADLGVPEPRVKRWIERRDVVNSPEPVKPLRGLRLYSITAWRAWYRDWLATRNRNRDGDGTSAQ